MSEQPHIAVVDDEREITTLLGNYLPTHGFRVTQLHSGHDLRALMATDPPSLILLDLGLGSEDGLAIAREAKERWSCGVVIVTGRSDAVDKVVGLELGADDYVTKPFELRELVARIRAVLRRIRPAAPDPPVPPGSERLRFDGWTVDVAARELLDASGRPVVLTSGEFDLLVAFVRNPGRVLSRDFLLDATRGRQSGPFDRTIDVQVGRLRRKLDGHTDASPLIKSVRGAGYLFVPAVH